MNILSSQYSLKHESFEIVISGCDGKCGNECHSIEAWDFNKGIDYKHTLESTLNKIKEFDLLIKWIWVYGGEPMLQNKFELVDLLHELKQTEKPIMLFTRFDLDKIPKAIKDICDYIKTGEYDISQKGEVTFFGVTLATKNQKIYKMNGE